MFLDKISKRSVFLQKGLVLGLVFLLGLGDSLYALPTHPQVKSGNLSIQPGGVGALQIEQFTQNAIINWEGFSLGSWERLTIQQPGLEAALLNRVIGREPSQLLGQLKANGQVYLINQNGILVGENARIDVGGFFASTQNVTDDDFLNGGSLTFSGNSSEGIVNLGSIETLGGDVILVGAFIDNQGEIQAPGGSVDLAAGREVLLTPESGLSVVLGVEESEQATGINQEGLIESAQAQLQAASGNVYELAVNQKGVIRATGVERKNGRILITAEGGTVAQQGELSALKKDGSGGTVLVGGDYRGENPDIPNADRTVLTEESLVSVSSLGTQGDGGRAIVWADEATRYLGAIEGRGGDQAGNGAFVEVSGKQYLDFRGVVDISAPFGSTGTLLLDPSAVSITNNSGANTNVSTSGTNPFEFSQTSSSSVSVLDVSLLETQLASSNVIVDTSTADLLASDGFISVDSALTWNTANRLTLKSGTGVSINADITATSGILEVLLGIEDPLSGSPTDQLTSGLATTLALQSLIIGENADAAPPGVNLPPSPEPLGLIDLQGIVDATTLSFSIPEGGYRGIIIENASNSIGEVVSIGTIGPDYSFSGNLSLFSSDALAVELALGTINGNLSLLSGGDLTLRNNTALTIESSTADDFLAVGSTGGSFLNNAGASALSDVGTGTPGRILVYSDNPTNTTLGGLNLTPVYNTNFNDDPPATLSATGNRVVYDLNAVLIINAADLNKTYGDVLPTLDLDVQGLVGSDTLNDAVTGSADLSTTATQASDVGTYPITVGLGALAATDYNYLIQLGSNGTLTVDPASLTIMADDATRRAGLSNPDFTATFVGLVNGDQASDYDGSLSVTSAADAFSPIGTYPIVPSGVTDPNYDISFVNGTLTVTDKATLLIDVLDAAKTYGQPNPAFDSNITGFEGGDDASIITGLVYNVLADETTGVGNYTITANGADAGIAYDINYQTGTLTINPAALLVTANDASRLYGGSNPLFSASFDSLAAGDTVADLPNLTFSTDALAGSGVGTYTITPSGIANPNYSVSYNTGTLTIDPTPLTITANDQQALYREPSPSLDASFSGFVLGEGQEDLNGFSLNTSRITESNVGDYPISINLGSNPNYDITSIPGTFSVLPQPLTLTVEDKTVTYGSAFPTFTTTTSGDQRLFYDSSGIVLSSPGTTSLDVGNYPINVTGFEDPNYSVMVVPGILTIDPYDLEIQADDKSRAYGDPNPMLTTSLVASLQYSDTLEQVVSDIQLSTSATVETPTGIYPISIFGTPINDNYNLTFTSGDLTINKRSIFIRPESVTRLYGDENPEFTIVSDGFVNGDTGAVVTSFEQVLANEFSSPGNYTISILSADSRNYAFAGFGTGQLIIEPRPLTISAEDKTREYGEPNPTLTATFDGLASFDNEDVITGLSLTTTATQSSPAQSLAISVDSDDNPNYQITRLPGTLTITPAELAISGDNVFREYGRANPDFTPDAVIGLKLGDTMDSLGLQIAGVDPQADVGTYDVGYSVTNPSYFVGDIVPTLTVLPAPVQFTVDNFSKTYGEPNPDSFGFRIAGLAFDENPEDVGQVLVPVDATSNVGTYNLIPELIDSNYRLEDFEAGRITILPRLLALKPENVTKIYGDKTPELEIQVAGSGLAPHHTLSDLVNAVWVEDTFLFSLDRSENSLLDQMIEVGSRRMTVDLLPNPDLENYVIASRPGLYTVVPRPVQIRVLDAEGTKGGLLPPPQFEVEGLPDFADRFTAFPDITFAYLAVNREASTQSYTVPGDVFIAESFSETTFANDYPSQTISAVPTDPRPFETSEPAPTPSTPEVEDESPTTIELDFQTFTVEVEEEEPATPSLTVSNSIVIEGGFDFTTDDLFPEEEEEESDFALRPSITYVRPTNYTNNSNYVVTEVTNGMLTLQPDPKEVEVLSLSQDLARAEKSFLEGATVETEDEYGRTREENVRAFGLSSEALPIIKDVLMEEVREQTLLGNPYLKTLIKEEYFERTGDSDALRREGLSVQEINWFLRDIHSNPKKQELLAPLLTNRILDLAETPRNTWSPAETALATQFESHLKAAASGVHRRMETKVEEWRQEQEALAEMSAPSMSETFTGNEPPYPELMKDAAIEYTETNIAASTIGTSVAATGTAVATSKAITSAAGVIAPYASTAAAKAGTVAPLTTAAGTAVPVAIVVGAVVVTTVRITQLVESENAKAEFERLGNPNNFSLAGFSLENEDGSPNTTNTAIMMTAMANMFSGVSPSP